MRIKVLDHRKNYIDLPMADAELNLLMRKMGVTDTVPFCKIVEVSGRNNPLGRLVGQLVNMDEVNFFIRRLESLTKYEQEVLSLYAKSNGVNNMKDLINLTYGTKGLSLITDFFNPEQVGKRLYMDEMQMLLEEEMQQIDFFEFAEKTLKESNVELLPYGVFVEHGFKQQEVYNGKTFPEYVYADNIVATVEVKNSYGDMEYLYLPTDICSMDKVKERLGVKSYSELKVVDIHNILLPESAVPSPNEIEDVRCFTLFNEMCQAVTGFDADQMKQFGMVIDFSGFRDFAKRTSLAKNLGDFEVNPLVHNDEEYGKFWIKESGLFEVDELLLPHIDYVSFAKDKKASFLQTSGYIKDGFVGATRPLEVYQKYGGEYAEPLEHYEEQLETFCLFSPLLANMVVDGEDEGELYGSDLVQYAEQITEAIEGEELVGEEARGLMHYYDRSQEVAGKVLSAYPKVTEINGVLYGVLECKIIDTLTEKEINLLKDYWTGQMSDGWGEGFEQRNIEVENGEIFVSFWNGGNGWSVMTEEELMGTQFHGIGMHL